MDACTAEYPREPSIQPNSCRYGESCLGILEELEVGLKDVLLYQPYTDQKKRICILIDLDFYNLVE